MSTMGAKDRKLWAREEIWDAVKDMVTSVCARPDTDMDDEITLKREAARVVKFLGFDEQAAPKGEKALPRPCILCKGKGTCLAVDSINVPDGTVANPRQEPCMVCGGVGFMPPDEG